MYDSRIIDPHLITTGKLHSILLSAVSPRPIAFASTINKNGVVNLAPFSYFNVFSARPPILVFSPARRGRDNTEKHTFQNIKEVPEVVINTVNFAIVEQMSLASAEYDKGVDEFKKSGLTPTASVMVSPPRVKESPVSFECKVIEVKELGQNPGAGNLIICEVLMIHALTSLLKTDDTLKSDKLDMVARMGDNFYTRTTKESIFEIDKPNSNLGIGVDALPHSIRNSKVLTGNDLGRLGNLPTLPTEEDFDTMDPRVDSMTPDQIHNLAKTKLAEGRNMEALAMLLKADQM